MYLYRLKTKFKVKLKRKLSKLGKFTCSIDENLQLKKNKLNNCSIEIETFIKNPLHINFQNLYDRQPVH